MQASWDIFTFQPDLHPFLRDFFRKKKISQLVVLADDNTVQYCYPLIRESMPRHTIITVKPGESHKTLRTCNLIWGKLCQKGSFDRNALLLILGGGVLCDLGAFCASVFHRGIPYMLVPTTLLAQSDACVGGKSAINFEGYKNVIGTFTYPSVVLISSRFLETLPKRELHSGYIEIVKHCLITGGAFWGKILHQQWDTLNWVEWIQQSVRLKMDIVQNDPYDRNQRNILNVGHTVGHAVESCSMFTSYTLRHGEAVAIGLITEAHIALQKKLLAEDTFRQMVIFLMSTCEKFILPSNHDVVAAMFHDKKNRQGSIRASLFSNIGRVCIDIAITKEEVYAALDYYRHL